MNVDSIDSLGMLAFQIAHFEGKPHTLTWTGGMIEYDWCFYEGGYSEFCQQA